MISARSVDHRQPGENSDRATVASSRLTTSASPLGIGRTSSGVAKLLYRSRGMTSSLLGTAWARTDALELGGRVIERQQAPCHAVIQGADQPRLAGSRQRRLAERGQCDDQAGRANLPT